jgi:hypothetical protein
MRSSPRMNPKSGELVGEKKHATALNSRIGQSVTQRTQTEAVLPTPSYDEILTESISMTLLGLQSYFSGAHLEAIP